MTSMDSKEPEAAYQIFTYRSKKRTVRFLVSPSVMQRIPYLGEILMRACADSMVNWPQSIVITAVDENRWVPGDSLHMVFPERLFDKVTEKQKKPQRWWQRLFLGGQASWPSWDIAWTLAYYLRPLQQADGPQDHDAMFLQMAIDQPFAYRPIGTTVRLVLMLPLLLGIIAVILLGPLVFTRNTKILYIKAQIQIAFDRAHGLSRTRQRLRELGEPEEKLKELVVRPCLNVVKPDEPE